MVCMRVRTLALTHVYAPAHAHPHPHADIYSPSKETNCHLDPGWILSICRRSLHPQPTDCHESHSPPSSSSSSTTSASERVTVAHIVQCMLGCMGLYLCCLLLFLLCCMLLLCSSCEALRWRSCCNGLRTLLLALSLPSCLSSLQGRAPLLIHRAQKQTNYLEIENRCPSKAFEGDLKVAI